MSEIKDHPNWRRLFMDLALRSFRRLHYDYGAAVAFDGEPDELNSGVGILLADERTVCAAIVHELLTNKFYRGGYVDKKDKEPRKYLSKIEVPEDKGGERKGRVDITITRQGRGGDGKLHSSVFIEAKRVHPYKLRYDVEDNEAVETKFEGTVNSQAIIDDVDNLIYVKDKNPSGHAYLLLWGQVSKSCPIEFVKSVFVSESHNGHRIQMASLRWLPLNWTMNFLEPGANQHLIVSDWIWIALVEIDPSESSCDTGGLVCVVP